VKQVTILCSADLSAKVREVLIEAGAPGFLSIPGAIGTKPGAAAPHGLPPRWSAEMFLAPVEDEMARRIVAALKAHAGECAIEPCLRVLVTPLEAVY
jgi:hypothetical protein